MSNRIVKLPSVESFGHLTPDKWLLLKTLEESAEMVEAGKQYLKASDPTDPSGIGREFDDHANCLACFGVNVGGELGEGRMDRLRARPAPPGHARRAGRRVADGRQPDYRVRHHRRGTCSGYGRLPRPQSGEGTVVSIISSDAKWAVLRRGVRLSPEEIRGTTKSKEYEAGFIAGATR